MKWRLRHIVLTVFLSCAMCVKGEVSTAVKSITANSLSSPRYSFVDGGFVTFTKTGTGANATYTPTYHAYLRDHLGSNRVVASSTGTAEQVYHYYPYGSMFNGGNMLGTATTPSQPWLYCGKELDTMHGLGWYDSKARTYDPVLGIFPQMDPLAEKYHPWSLYVYCMGNPLKYVDPKGEDNVNLLSDSEEETKTLSLDIKNFNSDDKVINVWAHGNEKGIRNGINGVSIKTADDFGKMLDEFSVVWKNRTESSQIIIVLHSCETKEFAMKLSEDPLFANVTIIAPDMNVQVRYNPDENGKGLKYVCTGVSNSSSNDPQIYLKETGYWYSYTNGKMNTKYSGKFQCKDELKPGSKGFSYKSIWRSIKNAFGLY